MRIALLGYGKMGKVIEEAAQERGHEISLRITSENADFDPSELQNTDAAIDFSIPSGVVDNIYKCFEMNVPVVVGTTGWYSQFDEVRKNLDVNEHALFHAPNFSIGVNLFFAVNQYLAELMNDQEQYDVRIDETHHKEKLDAPSGTAIHLAKDILNKLERKKKWVKENSENEDDLVVRSHRKEDVKGTHVVEYASEIDDITIEHKAKTRKGFAMGAVLAAEWVNGKKGLFTMKDMLHL